MKRVESNGVNIIPNMMPRYKYIMITFVILMVSTLLVAVFAIATNYKYVNEMAELRAQNQHNSNLATQILRATRNANDNIKCKPLSQAELPAANLFWKRPYITVTHNDLERNVPTHMETGVYRWLTPDHNYGLLTGGMTFNETSGHLRIPKNGTYYMFSTIRFRRSADLVTDVELTVDIKIISSCKFGHSGNRGYNTGFNPKHYVIIPKGKVGGYYSTHTSGIARLCKNDVIYLHIHNMKSNIQIRNGGGASTNLGAFMIAPNCQEDTDVPTTDTDLNTATPTTSESTKATSSPPDRCERRNCK